MSSDEPTSLLDGQSEDETSASVSSLWQDYHFLTVEMRRCLERRDVDLFLELINQRERLQKRIESMSTSIGAAERISIAQILKENEAVIMQMRRIMQEGRRHIELKEAYDSYSGDGTGENVDWQR
ncbi:hypothetical protein [Heliophilum fasciatum]|uniref:hypothetical protein n=1 Tax=Heliophilum fasciatum TaxID=35700 RepID=UPI00104CFCBE|nr:hypothetical protein [Heliophilum fasciatum]MCW2278800.1 hypothetical protein [Heliophilum fasciatum]